MKVELANGVRQDFARKALKILKYVIIIGVIAAVCVAGFKYYRSKTAAAAATQIKKQTSKVRKGDFSITVTGSGPLYAASKQDVVSKAGGTVTKVYFKEGDTVKAGDLMFELDSYNAGLTVDKLMANIAQTQKTQTSNQNSLQKLNVTAPFNGQITNIQAKYGDAAAKNAPLLTITDTSKLKLMLAFSGPGANEIAQGNTAVVYVQNLTQSVTGTVSYVSNKPYPSASGSELYSVEIYIDNPGSLKDGMKANAEIKTSQGVASSTDNGTLSYVNSQVLKTESGGTITGVNVKENQYVNQGELLVTMQNDDIVQNIDSTDLKIKDYQGQLESALKDLENYKIYAPIDGTIIKQSVNAGDVFKNAQVVSTITNTQTMEFQVSIDELDISKIKTGQSVSVTLDAIPETSVRPLTAEVVKIAVEGNSQNGVTTYPVTIRVSNQETASPSGEIRQNMTGRQNGNQAAGNRPADQQSGENTRERLASSGRVADRLQAGSASGNNVNADVRASLRSGMNANAEIFITNKKDTLMIPIQAVYRILGKTYVLVNGEGNATESSILGNTNGQNNPASGGATGGSQAKPSGGTSGNTSAQKPGASGAGGNNNTAAQRSAGSAVTGNSLLASARNNPQLKQYYDNTQLKPVEVGINNEMYVEIISGLNEGDEVILPPTSSGQNNATRVITGGMSGGAMGGMLGGASSAGGKR